MSLSLKSFLTPKPSVQDEDIEMMDHGWGESHNHSSNTEKIYGDVDDDNDRVKSHKLPIRSAASMDPKRFSNVLNNAVVTDRQYEQSSSSSDEEESNDVREAPPSQSKTENLNQLVSIEERFRSIRNEDNFQVLSSSYSQESRNKRQVRGEHGRNQRALYDNILECRIRLEPLMSAAFRLPKPDVISKLKSSTSSKDLLDPLKKCEDSLKEILQDLLEIRDSTSSSTKQKRKRTSSQDLTWEDDINIFDTELLPHVTNVTDTWHRKAQLLTGDFSGKNSRKRLKALNRTPMLQVQDTMQDVDTLVSLAQQRPENVPRLAIAESESDIRTNQKKKRHRRFDERGREIQRLTLDRSSRVRQDSEIYTDSRFYAATLKQFLESHSSSSADASAVNRRHRKRGGRRKNVDRRATKGRKLKFVEHPKLLNFMTPSARPTVTLDVERFFSSLFRS